MTETPNLKLKKLGDNSIFSVEEIDKNMDIIDEEVEKVKTGKEPTIIKKTGFNLDKTDSTETDSSILLATAKAVKKVWDKAKEAIGFTDTNKNAILNNTEQIENLSEFIDETILINDPYLTLTGYKIGKIIIFSFGIKMNNPSGNPSYNITDPNFQGFASMRGAGADDSNNEAVELELQGLTNSIRVLGANSGRASTAVGQVVTFKI